MDKIKRSRDVISGYEDLENLHQFENFPVFMGCIKKSREKDILVDMQWEISKDTGMIQLNPKAIIAPNQNPYKLTGTILP